MNNPQPSPSFLAQNSGPVLTAVASVFMVLVIMVAGLRYVTQHLRQRPFGLDDLFSYIGLVFIIGECILSFRTFKYPSLCYSSVTSNTILVLVKTAGVGRHIDFLEETSPEKLSRELVLLYPTEIIYISAFTFSKLSILWMYLRIFTSKPMIWYLHLNNRSLLSKETTANKNYRITHALIFVVVSTWISETATAVFQCQPIHKAWLPAIEGHCVKYASFSC